MIESVDSFDIALPTFALLALFSSTAGSAADAEREVAEALQTADEPYDEVRIERREDDGSWKVVARFVLASVDAHTAVSGLHETLTSAGLQPDEVWLDRRVS